MSESLTIRMPATSPPDPVFVRAILVRPGDMVELDQLLVELEMEEEFFELTAPNSGTIESLLVSVGDKLECGTPILVLRLQL
jgi:pyruvate dehydrogenase E2 component (dihydrolipoamide acetyltransferase)